MLLGESTSTDEKPKFSSACEHLNFPLASPPAKSQLDICLKKCYPAITFHCSPLTTLPST